MLTSLVELCQSGDYSTGEILRRARFEKNLRLSQLSRLSGFTANQLRNLEVGDCPVSLKALVKLYKHLDLDMYIVGKNIIRESIERYSND